MTAKIVIRAEQIVARKRGSISYADDHGNLKKAKEAEVHILQEGEEPPPPVEETPTADAPEQAQESPAEPEVPPPTEGEPTQPPATTRKVRKVATKTKAKTKAAAKKAPRKQAEAGVRTIKGKPVDLSQYTKVKTSGGGSSYNNGDPVAQKLQGKELDEVYGITAKALKVEEKELRSKYKHLNPGMQRMSLGNRLRKVLIPKK